MKMATCYNYYILNKIEQPDMCVGCCHYNGLVLKKKAQAQMGRRFQCKGLMVELPIDSRCTNSDEGASEEKSTTSAPSESILDVLSPPRKSVRATLGHPI